MDKREILKLLEDHFGEKPRYMGAPSFAYQVTVGEEGYTIDREGKIINADGAEVELMELLRDENETNNDMEVVLSMEEHTGSTLRNLINMLTSKQNLIRQAFNLKTNIISEEFAKALNKKVIFTVEDFEEVTLEIGIEKCPGITFDFRERTISFKLDEGEPDKLKAFRDFVAIININSQNLKHTSIKPTVTDNPRYSFRTWLTRLGMNGHEFKSTRKIILMNLQGNSAFRNKPVNNSL